MEDSIYKNGVYKKKNPDWHDSDAKWKAEKIFKILEKNNLRPTSICDVGCGTGGVLLELKKSLKNTRELLGVDISREAIDIAKKRESAKLKFQVGQFPQKKYDLIMAIDVVEHLENYANLFRKLKTNSNLVILHIPVDVSIYSFFRKTFYSRSINSVGHLHFFTKESLLSIIEHYGFEILDYNYTAPGIEKISGTLNSKIGKYVRIVTKIFGTNVSSKIMCGYSLLILARPINKKMTSVDLLNKNR
ncbi:MAG: class I SAM-dependent methyltransferase [Candidatus Berkelbacteria bacterium]